LLSIAYRIRTLPFFVHCAIHAALRYSNPVFLPHACRSPAQNVFANVAQVDVNRDASMSILAKIL
jgi:hypothetical protein